MIKKQLIFGIAGILLLWSCNNNTEEYTRGVGIYPGAEKDNFAPVRESISKEYKNIALHSRAWHSSSYDHSLTAQLVCDGIIETKAPSGWKISDSGRESTPHIEKTWILDEHEYTGVKIEDDYAWIMAELDDKELFEAPDSFTVEGRFLIDENKSGGINYILSASDNREDWTKLSEIREDKFPNDPIPQPWDSYTDPGFRFFRRSAAFENDKNYKYYKLEVKSPLIKEATINDWGLVYKGERLPIGGPASFNSSWKSLGTEKEWIKLDLGALCSFDKINIHWLNPAGEFSIESSPDDSSWEEIKNISANSEMLTKTELKGMQEARYLRFNLKQPADGKEFNITEIEVFGKGKPVYQNKPEPGVNKKGELYLSGGNWKLQRASLVEEEGESISTAAYSDPNWVTATVPGTVLMTYVNIGAVPHLNYGDDQFMISESFFYSNFWYRNEFTVPAGLEGENISLNFDGVNWKADIFLNGEKLGLIEGAYTRAAFDISDKIKRGEKNYLAVRIHKNANPGYTKTQTKWHPDFNGGILGADNPTFHASIGWDWLPTIPGRNIGIWNDVFISASGDVTIEDPYISYDLPLPDTSFASVEVELGLTNHSNKEVDGKLQCNIGPLSFEYPIKLEAGEHRILKLGEKDIESLHWEGAQLWWPNGYGVAKLYHAKFKFVTAEGELSDKTCFKTGVREMSYDAKDGNLKVYINGRRFIARGGNWGFPEANLLYREREYDIAVGYHRDMNFTMIRNWVGMTGDNEFYEACDRHGIMIWEDFWLANPYDGPDPDNNKMFLANARDKVSRVRKHPSIAFYCARNEGFPPKELDEGLQDIISELHTGMLYFPHSATGTVSGYGPYRAQTVEQYFKERATPKFHSEMGMPNIMNMESFSSMMPDSAMWPHGNMWGVHDFSLQGAQGAVSYLAEMDSTFGTFDNIEEWIKYAQWMNYKGYRAMFEAQGENRMGLLIWMSHSAWPSLVWQTYDYYFDPTAAYFASKKANQPIHIQWNAYTDSIEVVNFSYLHGQDLNAEVEILDIKGKLIHKEEYRLESKDDSRVLISKHPYPNDLTEVYFLRLKLLKDGELISDNNYWRALKGKDMSALRDMPGVKVKSESSYRKDGDKWYIDTKLSNETDHPALMVRLKVVGEESGKRMLPVIFSDNYRDLMPGENYTIRMQLKAEDTRGENPLVVVCGLNIE